MGDTTLSNFSWSPSSGLNNAAGPTVIAKPTATTTYVVEMNTGVGCTAFDTIVIALQNCPLQADFSIFSQGVCVPAYFAFNDITTNQPTFWHWDFGNGITSNQQEPAIIYSSPGAYNIKLVSGNGSEIDSVVKSVTIFDSPVASFTVEKTDTCSVFSRSFAFKNTSTGADTYAWNLGSATSFSSVDFSHTYFENGTHLVRLTASNSYGCTSSIAQYVQVQTYRPIVPTAGAITLHATSECTDSTGWTNYFNDNSTPQTINDDILLLSLKKNGNDIGTTGNGSFDVSVSATSGAGSNSGILLTNPLITNPSGFWVMNRYWQVKPVTQPATPVSVRFYFNDQDLDDVNGSYPTHDLNYTDLLFYKTIGGNPDPTTNLQGASRVISLENGLIADTNHWSYIRLDSNRHFAEFAVNSFSGGGGGATGNGLTLPLKLLSLTAVREQSDIRLRWIVGTNSAAEKYVVEKSLSGTDYTPAYSILAEDAGNKTSFTFLDKNAAVAGTDVFYRIKIMEKTGSFSYSKTLVVSVKNQGIITISPNPARDFITLHTNIAQHDWQIVFIDNPGRKILTKSWVNGESSTINLSALSGGYYHISVMENRKQLYSKNILIRN